MMTRTHGRIAAAGPLAMLVLALASPAMIFKQDGEKLTRHDSGQLGEGTFTAKRQ